MEELRRSEAASDRDATSSLSLIKLLLEETEREERSLWYTHCSEVEQRALQALTTVLANVQYRLNNPEK